MKGGLDWPGLLRVGLGPLRLSPRDFWALTPQELRLMLGEAGEGQGPLRRADLDELLAAFPDGKQGRHDGGRNG